MTPPPFGARWTPQRGSFTPRNELERGSVAVLAIVAVALAIALAFGVARLGHAASDRARADTAADAAALAAAGVLARGGSAASATAAAVETATTNGARLERCDCAGPKPIVEVHVGDATGRARAEVRFECFADPSRCSHE
jgi:secretion/DNA translocation related TadE-like protein